MTSEINWLEGGTITSPKGFNAGATYSGIRTYTEDKLDLGILCSESVCTVAGTFTKNMVKSPSVVLDQERVATGRAQAVVINSGIANACVGDQGMTDAIEMAALAAAKLGLEPELVLACSTGLIGVELPMGLIRSGTDKIEMKENGGNELARAICTTDLVSKEAAVSFDVDGVTYTLGGIAKGSGMIHPNMATMLAFLATDAPVDGGFLQAGLSEAVDASFNMISVDGDTSTNDTVLLLANGAAGGSPIDADAPGAAAFRAALDAVCVELAKAIARDGEGRVQARRGCRRERCQRERRARRRPVRGILIAGQVRHTRRRPQLGPHHRGAGLQRRAGHGRARRPPHQQRLHHGGRTPNSLLQGRRCAFHERAGREPAPGPGAGRPLRHGVGLRPQRRVRHLQQRLHHLATGPARAARRGPEWK